MIWKDSGWRCRIQYPMGRIDSIALTHLYQPLVGTSAISIYLTLYNQLLLMRSEVTDIYGHSYLMQLTGLNHEQLLEARYFLEAVGLLNTYEIQEGYQNFYEYEIIPPLTPVSFFQSDVLSLALCHALGKERFVQLKRSLLAQETGKRSGTDITKSFQEVFGSFSPLELAKATEVEQEMSWMMKEDFSTYLEGREPVIDQDDLSFIPQRLGSRLRPGSWTKEVEERIREIRFLYQLDEWDLLKALQNPDVLRQGEIDLQRLRDFVRSEYQLRFGTSPTVSKKPKQASKPEPVKPVPETEDKSVQLSEEEQHFQQLAKLSPLQLLSFYQDGARIPDSDVALVESLLHDYGLPPGVVNVLLEYVLLKYNYRLPKALVAKIAGHWKRLRIKTVEQALEQARKENWERTPQKSRIKTRSVGQEKKKEKIPSALRQQLKKGNSERKPTTQPESVDDDWQQINQQLAAWEQQKQRRSSST